MKTEEKFQLIPIGYFSCEPLYPQEVPRQAVHANNKGQVKLNSSRDWAQALSSLEGFSHIWLIFLFHKNSQWKNIVQPPRTANGKPAKDVGVFASRSPYRPNPIGMSLVELVHVEGRCIEVKNHDLIDSTPILDIKPYISYSDSTEFNKEGWTEDYPLDEYKITFNPQSENQLNWLMENKSINLAHFIHSQLSYDPFDNNRKRVRSLGDNEYEIAFRTWRISFKANEKREIKILSIYSGYTQNELKEPKDPYEDKSTHRDFCRHFKL